MPTDNIDKDQIEADVAIPIHPQERIGALDDIRSDLKGTIETKRELSPEKTDELISTLKARFDSVDKKLKKALESIDFEDVEKSLRAAPEKLYTLQKLEETGGEPQVIGIDGNEFVFEDRSAESPSGRRDLDIDQAAAQAKEFGADMQSPKAYLAMQKTGKYDICSGSSLKTSAHIRKNGNAIFAARYDDTNTVMIYQDGAEKHTPRVGWRASIRVKKA